MSGSDIVAVGVDGYPRGWVAVALRGGRFAAARAFRSFSAVLEAHAEAACLAVDIPIGAGPRAADELTRTFVGPRFASVFPTPPADVIALDDYREAVRRHPSLSRQSFALFAKIREVAPHAADPRVVEAHPEASFRALKYAPLEEAKTTWNGFWERRRLLAEAGVVLPDALPVRLPLVDVLDAAAAAWTADRYARGEAERLGDDAAAVWY